ncbi:unnamed protein product, partial [Rotaria sp. Silwood1]
MKLSEYVGTSEPWL